VEWSTVSRELVSSGIQRHEHNQLDTLQGRRAYSRHRLRRWKNHPQVLHPRTSRENHRDRRLAEHARDGTRAITRGFHFDETFDYIFSFHTLHWVKNKVKVFRNVHDHLGPRGKFVLLTSGRQNETISRVFLSEKWKEQLQNYGPRFHSADASATQSLLHEAGLSVQRLDAEYWSTFYADKNDLIKWLMTWVPYATGMSYDDSVVFADEIAENILTESVKNGVTDSIEFKTEMLVIEAGRDT